MRAADAPPEVPLRATEAMSDDSARAPLRARTVAWSVVAGVTVGGALALALASPRGARFEARLPWSEALPTGADWPRAPLEGERVRIEPSRSGPRLIVGAGSAAEARALARAFAARAAPTSDELREGRDRVRAAWRELARAQPPARASRAAACAAELLARARWGLELAGALPLSAPVAPPAPRRPPATVEDAWLNVTWVVDERDPALLTRALLEATRADQRWFEDAAVWAGAPLTARAESWRSWQASRAELLEPLAARLVATEGSAQRALLGRMVARRLPAFDDQAGEPWAAFAGPGARVVRPLVLPIASAWLPALLVGAGAGSLAALLVLLPASRRWPGAAPRRAPRRRVRMGASSEGIAAVHVVTGRTPSLVVRALLELAAPRIALGERVLIVDGSPRLRLHERLGREARWGLLECLAAEMPVLGLVHYAGHPGLHLLSHGDSARPADWSRLGRVLAELLPHFGRIVMAVEPTAPIEFGSAIRDLPVEGWWAGRGRALPLGAGDVVARLSIALQPLDLSSVLEPSLEALAERVGELRRAMPAGIPAWRNLPAPAAPVVAPRPPLEPIVLDCDLQVLQRLRFLAWMRRVEAEERGDGAPASS
jgi:hypothetical protein